MKRKLMLIGLVALLGASSTSFAGVRIGVFVGPRYVPAPVFVAPAPVLTVPAPVYVGPPAIVPAPYITAVRFVGAVWIPGHWVNSAYGRYWVRGYWTRRR
jgi:hypothetical protein